jgi:hypothetical protein
MLCCKCPSNLNCSSFPGIASCINGRSSTFEFTSGLLLISLGGIHTLGNYGDFRAHRRHSRSRNVGSTADKSDARPWQNLQETNHIQRLTPRVRSQKNTNNSVSERNSFQNEPEYSKASEPSAPRWTLHVSYGTSTYPLARAAVADRRSTLGATQQRPGKRKPAAEGRQLSYDRHCACRNQQLNTPWTA